MLKLRDDEDLGIIQTLSPQSKLAPSQDDTASRRNSIKRAAIITDNSAALRVIKNLQIDLSNTMSHSPTTTTTTSTAASSRSTTHHPPTITHLPSLDPHPPPPGQRPLHHIGSPPTAFQNPWPSADHGSNSNPLRMLQVRFSKDRNFVPVPENREGLVGVRECVWGREEGGRVREGLKVTWIGHATWVFETTAMGAQSPGKEEEVRGIRFLCDPVFAERTSPFSFIGPKRYTPVPCTVAQLPFIDAMIQSHNHYDHVDSEAIKDLYIKQNGRLHIFCALGSKAWYLSLLGGQGLKEEGVTELDWWEGVKFGVEGVGSVRVTCTPAQHFSARTPFDRNKTLWCSWVFEEEDSESPSSVSTTEATSNDVDRNPIHPPRKLFFAGDTGYRAVASPNPTPSETAAAPTCPAFRSIGSVYGPFDLALLPIGLYSPRNVMSAIHCAPEDSVCIHRDLRSKKSIGMHWGTVRGGLSGQYEDVREPPRRWREACEAEGLKWGVEVGLCEIGETVVV